jgi:hypothetical protein
MTSAPPPPPGWNPKVVVPQCQQQAQDSVIGYLKKTLKELPAGTMLDATRYGSAGSTAPCKDVVNGTPPMEFSTIGELKGPSGSDPDATIAKIGDVPKGWGWFVMERDGFCKPDRFGYAPDGYSLQIVAAYPAGHPPTLQGSSPCFPGDLARNDIPVPVILKAD